MGVWLIYMLSDPREPDFPRYIGWTATPLNVRLAAHVQEAKRKPRTYRACWIRSLIEGGLSPSIKAVEQGSGDPGPAEQSWIAQLRALGFPLTNGTAGGRGVLGARWRLTDEQRAAIAARPRSKKERPPKPPRPRWQPSEELRLLWSKQRTGKKQSPETRAKRAASMKGRRVSDETREKIAEARRREWAEGRRGPRRGGG